MMHGQKTSNVTVSLTCLPRWSL